MCRLRSFLYLVLLLCLQTHALVARLCLTIHLLLQPLVSVVAFRVFDRSLSLLIFHVLLNLI